MAEEAAAAEAEAEPEAPEAGGSEAGEGGGVAFDEDAFLAEYTGTTPQPDAAAPGGGADDAESPADGEKAGAASDDDDEPPAADPVAAELAHLRESLEALRAERSGAVNVLEAAIAESPEIQQLESELRAATEDARTAHTRTQTLITTYNKTEKDIARLEGKLEIAADVDKLDIRDELRQKTRDLKDVETDYREQIAKIKNAQAAENELKGRRARVVEDIKGQLNAQSTQAQVNEATKREAALTFGQSYLEGAKKYGIDPKSETGARIRETIKAHVTLRLRLLQQQDPNAPKVDLQKLVAKEWAIEAKERRLGEKARFASASAARREADAGKPARGVRLPASPSNRVPKDLVNDASYWKARAARITGEDRLR